MFEPQAPRTCAYCLHFTRKGIVPHCEHFNQTVSCFDTACQKWRCQITGAKLPTKRREPQ